MSKKKIETQNKQMTKAFREASKAGVFDKHPKIEKIPLSKYRSGNGRMAKMEIKINEIIEQLNTLKENKV